MQHPTSGEWVQFGFGYDVFMTRSRETYFAFCYYGVEYVINLGGPALRGYENWLAEFDNISPLIERLGCKLDRSTSPHRLLAGSDDQRLAGVEFDRKVMEVS